MDHLPLPTDASIPPWSVPFVSLEPYPLGAGPFREFPARYLRSIIDSNRPADLDRAQILLSLLQTWLFFGVITEYFQENIDMSMFCRVSEDGLDIIDSSQLQSLRDRWLTSRNFSAGSNQSRISNQNTLLLVQALHACEQFEKADLDLPSLDKILLSVRILICSLTIMTQNVSQQSPDLDHLLQRLTLRPCGTRGIELKEFQFLDHMISNGWW